MLQGARGPLDNMGRLLTTGSGMHQYFVKLVPTLYKAGTSSWSTGGSNNGEVHSYQFSVTEHLRRIDLRTATAENLQGLLPGVFFHYDLSPMRVRVEEKRRSFGHFLTRVCAIIGGVFTVMGLVDSLVFRVGEQLQRGKRGAAGGILGGLRD